MISRCSGMRQCQCPNCNATLQFGEDRDFGFCEFCGTKIMLDDYRETHRIVDEARIRQAEVDKVIRLRELELEEVRLKAEMQSMARTSKLKSVLTTIWLVISLCLIAITIGIMFFGGDWGPLYGFDFLGLVSGPIIVGGGVIIFKVIPDKEAEKHMRSIGAIKFPKSLEPFSEKNYNEVYTALTNAGFNNISCINMGDVMFGLFTKVNSVDSISVDGKEITSGGKYYLPNVPITIHYHGR